METQGVIKEAVSEWCFPLVIVRKKDNTWRCCVDFRALNAVTVKDVMKFPRIDSILDSLGGSNFYTSFDLMAGYWQIALDPESKHKATVILDDGRTFTFQRMPFGLSFSPNCFSRLMNLVLKENDQENVSHTNTKKKTDTLIYLDDVILFTETNESQLDGLKRILGKFERAGLKLKPQKLQILVQKLVFLGHQINQGTISPNPDKLEIIKELKPPINKKTCRSVCGLLSYFWRYVQNYAAIAKPLTDLLKKSGNFEWPPAAVEALSRLKQELLKAPVLELPNLSHDFCLQTDTSSVGIGAVLFNINPNGKESIVQYASRALTEAERKYSTVERECLAAVVYIEHFRQFLLVKKLTLRVDQKSLI
ncbi:hypothetical protein QYM36_017973 [Artemia franciscana]|uniref:RNA-directed DNA polymerase n=1 Tax=Artemia franciscana TaxID=6661 RepID=A0AA88KUG3_ARTSF|nr:hypothetical protein QYM36_017973 [Artemia franciscana]